MEAGGNRAGAWVEVFDKIAARVVDRDVRLGPAAAANFGYDTGNTGNLNSLTTYTSGVLNGPATPV